MGRGLQLGFSSLIFRKQEGWWDWNSPSSRSGSQAWQLLRGGCDENTVPERPRPQGLGWGTDGSRALALSFLGALQEKVFYL